MEYNPNLWNSLPTLVSVLCSYILCCIVQMLLCKLEIELQNRRVGEGLLVQRINMFLILMAVAKLPSAIISFHNRSAFLVNSILVSINSSGNYSHHSLCWEHLCSTSLIWSSVALQYELGIIPVLQIRKPRYREVKWLAKGTEPRSDPRLPGSFLCFSCQLTSVPGPASW